MLARGSTEVSTRLLALWEKLDFAIALFLRTIELEFFSWNSAQKPARMIFFSAFLRDQYPFFASLLSIPESQSLLLG